MIVLSLFPYLLMASLLGYQTGAERPAEPDWLKKACPTDAPVLLDKNGTPRILSGSAIIARAVRCIAPKFPGTARQMRIKGTVVVGILVDKSGRGECVRLLSGHPILAGSAIDAARQWEFRPMIQKRRGVSFYGTLAFRYSTSGAANHKGSCLDAHW